MAFVKNLNEDQILLIKFWLPAIVTGFAVWLMLLFIGDTPLVRSSGLALIIVGVCLALRRMGSALATIGGLTLALSPAFWAQTGGGQGEPATIVIALASAGLTVLLAILVSKRPYLGFGLGLIVFAALFFSQIGTPRSIRLTGLVVGWLMYLVIDMLLLTNPRPEDSPMILRDGGLKTVDGAISARPYHTYGVLLIVAVGIVNDPLMIILMPFVVLSLLYSNTRRNWWYWGAIVIVALIGLRGFWLTYMVDQRHFLVLSGWQNGANWITMIQLFISQFTIAGMVLSLIGLTRLARWYPSLGTVSMVGFSAYWLFGTIYTGPNQSILLLPIYIIFVLWMTYAVLAISEWASKSVPAHPVIGRYLVITTYGILPLILLANIIGS